VGTILTHHFITFAMRAPALDIKISQQVFGAVAGD